MKILVIQIRQLGDVLLSSPMAKALKEHLKGPEVHFLTSSVGSEILRGNPFIDKTLTIKEEVAQELRITLSVRKELYDAVIDVQRTGRSQRITFFSGAPLRVAFKKSRRNFFYNRLVEWENRGYTTWERIKLLEGIGVKAENYKDYVPEFFNYMEVKSLKLPESYFTVVPTARKSEKMWPAEKFSELIGKLYRKLKIPAVVLYGPGEKEVALKVAENTNGEVLIPENPLPIGESATVIKGALFFIGLNSFASHLSIASGTKTVVIDKKHSGWFPPLKTVKEVYGKNSFPEVEDVLKAVLSLTN